MKFTRKNAEKLAKSVNYNPEKIGIAILKCIGYSVDTYVYSDSVYVSDKNGKIVFAKSR